LPLLALAMTRDTILTLFYVGISATMILNYALHDPTLFARWQLDDPQTQLAAPRWTNSFLNLLLLGAWTLYLFFGARLSRAKTFEIASSGG